jgi:alkanesulfonate monooxygenase SsuD/methylene tetrahydromethanopterin reductase-like flavin-dependent oxidoreductase (luciferase family)
MIVTADVMGGIVNSVPLRFAVSEYVQPGASRIVSGPGWPVSSFASRIADHSGDTVEAAQAARDAQLAFNGITDGSGVPLLLGSPEHIAETLAPYLALGFSTVIVRMPAPFDRETIDRLPEVLAHLR